MGYLLDTNTIVFFFRGHPQVVQRWQAAPPDTLHLCSIVLYELLVGVETSTRPERRRQDVEHLRRYLRDLDHTAREAAEAARLAGYLRPRGEMIGLLDVQIAATALVHGLTIVTNNTREFSRVPGLRVEDWTALP